jgi:hypothetical protein
MTKKRLVVILIVAGLLSGLAGFCAGKFTVEIVRTARGEDTDLRAIARIVEILLTPEEGEVIATSESPEGRCYRIEARLYSGGATSDWAVRAFIIDGSYRKQIYFQYHEHEADISWLSDSVVVINGIELDLSKNERYDYRWPNIR